MKNEYEIDGDIVRINLTQGQEAVIDLADMELVGQFRWCAAEYEGEFYAQATVWRLDGCKSTLKMHRLLCPTTADKPYVDHINRCGLDNRRTNIRPCSPLENKRNQSAKSCSSSNYKGVSLNKSPKKWSSQINVGGKTYNLGRYSSEEDAALAYDKAARQLFGDFMVLNFPEVHDYSGIPEIKRKSLDPSFNPLAIDD